MKAAQAILIVLCLAVAACQPVADARAKVCDQLRTVVQSMTDISGTVNNIKTDMTVGDVRAKLRTIRQGLQAAQPVAGSMSAGDSVTAALQALDQADKALDGTSDSTPLSQVADKVRQPLDSVRQTGEGLSNAICAAK